MCHSHHSAVKREEMLWFEDAVEEVSFCSVAAECATKLGPVMLLKGRVVLECDAAAGDGVMLPSCSAVGGEAILWSDDTPAGEACGTAAEGIMSLKSRNMVREAKVLQRTCRDCSQDWGSTITC